MGAPSVAATVATAELVEVAERADQPVAVDTPADRTWSEARSVPMSWYAVSWAWAAVTLSLTVFSGIVAAVTSALTMESVSTPVMSEAIVDVVVPAAVGMS